jgi:hypothetical protein
MITCSGATHIRHVYRRIEKHVRVAALSSIAMLAWSNDVSAQTSSLRVTNSGFVPIDLRIIDTICGGEIFEGRIPGNAGITIPACVDRQRKVNLILTDLSRGQSYRFNGPPRTIALRRGT